jgi:hypothetical protein
MFKINNKNLISFGFLAFLTFILISTPQNAKAEICTLFEGSDTYEGYCNSNYGYNYNGYYNSNYSNNNNYNYYNNGNNWNGWNGNNNNNINSIPSVISVSPNSGKINANIVITVSGSGFVPSSNIRLNNSNIPTTFINSGTLRGQISSFELNTKGDYLISVFNPAPGGGFSNSVNFTATPNIASSTTTSKTATTKTSTTSTKKNTITSTNTKSDKETNVKELAAGAIFGYNSFMPSSLLQWIFFFIFILLAVVLWRKLYVSESERSTPLKHA